MKIAFLIAWAVLAIEVAAVAALFLTKNAGDDAAGRGVATGYGIVLLPLILLCGGLLYWGQGSSSKALQWTALLVVSVPFLIGGGLWASNAIEEAGHRRRAANAGNFTDPHLTALAHAIDRHDRSAVQSLLQQSPKIDWTARNQSDATLLGHAIRAVLTDYGGTDSVELVRVLIAQGAPVSGDPTYPGIPLLQAIVDGNTPGTIALLRLVLDAGADPNTPDRDGLPLIHVTHSWHGVEKLKELAGHGADLRARNNRTDRPQWSALMNAAYMQDWDLALFFLEHGVAPNYQSPDGKTLASILTERPSEQPSPAFAKFQAALNRSR